MAIYEIHDPVSPHQRAIGEVETACAHQWAYSEEERMGEPARCYCALCGADGDA